MGTIHAVTMGCHHKDYHDIANIIAHNNYFTTHNYYKINKIMLLFAVAQIFVAINFLSINYNGKINSDVYAVCR